MRLSDDWRLRLRLESTRCGVGARCSCWGGVWYGTTDDCWMCVVPSPPAVAPGRGDAGEDDEEEEEEEEEEEKDILRGAARAAGAGSGGGGRGRGCGAGSFSFHAEFNFNLLGIFVWGNTMYFPTYFGSVRSLLRAIRPH